LTQFALLDTGSGAHFLECHFWGNGVAAMTSEMTIVVAEVNICFMLILFIGHDGFVSSGALQQ
jgi:hypothetical protein